LVFGEQVKGKVSQDSGGCGFLVMKRAARVTESRFKAKGILPQAFLRPAAGHLSDQRGAKGYPSQL
jgi:hypothetical protein